MSLYDVVYGIVNDLSMDDEGIVWCQDNVIIYEKDGNKFEITVEEMEK